MLDNRELHRLAALNTAPNPTLSLYLALDASREERLLALSELLKKKEQKFKKNGSRQVWEELSDDVAKTLRFVEDLPSSPGRGLALFACKAQDLFEAHNLEVPLDNLLEVSPAPYIRPLAALAGDLCPTLTVLLDSRRARFFHSFLGAASELEQAKITSADQVPVENGDRGRTGDSHLSRRAEQAQTRHFKEVAATAKQISEELECLKLVLGGSRQAVESLGGQLHPYLNERLSGSFHLDVNATLSQVASEVSDVLRDARRTGQEELLANLADNLGPGGQAATGLNQVLGALFEGKVHTLFVRRGLMQSGGVCPSCGRLRHVAGECPICGQAMAAVDDIINLAVGRAMASGARLEQIDGNSALDDLGGIAALLRYA